LKEKNRGSGLESRDYGRRDPSRCQCGYLYPQKLALTSLTSGSRSVFIVRSRTQATEFSLVSRKVFAALGRSPRYDDRRTLEADLD
jgi:hypothetical protein